jgi:cysteinyl-tRNA synthetase
MDKPFDPMTVRFFMMQAHYRSTLDFTSEALLASEKGHTRLQEAMSSLAILQTGESSTKKVQEYIDSFYDAMNDDFNTPVLIANLFEVVKYINSIQDGKASISKTDLNLLRNEMNAFVTGVLGLSIDTPEEDNKLEPIMKLVLDLRQEARENKDWSTSDKIRDGLAKAGITVKDSKDGSTWN